MPQARRPQSHESVWELSAGDLPGGQGVCMQGPLQHLLWFSNAFKGKTTVKKPLRKPHCEQSGVAGRALASESKSWV